mmetsp:Transcript_27713/g.38975  ORF Transcript_27713/g.38975 Transcript_27713/m.38975 type:complete len:338 (-) Transcript_27713:142-1155(-)
MNTQQVMRRNIIRAGRHNDDIDGNSSDTSVASTVGTEATAEDETMKPHDFEEKVTKKKKGSRRMRRRRSYSAPARFRKRENLIENHFNVDRDPNARVVVLPGLPKHEKDFARDSHDFFNLVALIPLVVLNLMNWDREKFKRGNKIEDAWTGDWFDMFFQITVLYFVIDLAWILVLPRSVNSPGTIIKHHVATLLYLLVPFKYPEYRWFMGACMIVEMNTWFLIARRVFNKQGFPPWIIDLPFLFSIRVKLISVFFYLTWIGTRCILYPLLWFEFYDIWGRLSEETGTVFNLFAFVLSLHTVFVLLNLKWTYDLIMSKMRWWRKLKKNGEKQELSKGL